MYNFVFVLLVVARARTSLAWKSYSVWGLCRHHPHTFKHIFATTKTGKMFFLKNKWKTKILGGSWIVYSTYTQYTYSFQYEWVHMLQYCISSICVCVHTTHLLQCIFAISFPCFVTCWQHSHMAKLSWLQLFVKMLMGHILEPFGTKEGIPMGLCCHMS